jgi:hypothetical protein
VLNRLDDDVYGARDPGRCHLFDLFYQVQIRLSR